MIDLAPAATRLATIVANIGDDQLTGPTPCPDYEVGDLLEHVGGLAVAFRTAATKELPGDEQPPSGDRARLPADWRTAIPAALTAMAEAWRDPEAWSGMTMAGGVDLTGEVAGLVALDELVVHGWDLARSTGQPFDVDDASIDGASAFVSQFSGPGTEDQRTGLFGPEVAVAADASALDRLLAMTGRDPGWTPGH